MVISTRNKSNGTSQNTMNEEMREMIREMITTSLSGIQESIYQLNQTMHSFTSSQDGMLVQQNYHTTEINRLKNGEGTSKPMHYTRMTKLEFPKFSAEDVKVDWSFYESEILKRFGASYEDPMEELKNLKQDGSVTEIGLVVKMFKPKTLYDAYHLAKMQEATKAAMARRYTPILNTPKVPYNKHVYPKSQTTLALPATPSNKPVTSSIETTKRQLSRKEYEKKRAKNICFYYDQKYVPGHKCLGQVLLIKLLTEEECLGEESDSDQDIVYNVEEDKI
ncbi:hypothetical protein Tco_1191986 [Tanacetum coccineum]